ncbi:MAG: hypothetical protein ACK4KV_09455 [Rhodocyclaceae bacterium]
MTRNRQRRIRWWMREQLSTIARHRRDGLLTTREAATWMRTEGAPMPVALRLLSRRASA